MSLWRDIGANSSPDLTLQNGIAIGFLKVIGFLQRNVTVLLLTFGVTTPFERVQTEALTVDLGRRPKRCRGQLRLGRPWPVLSRSA
jgi:hypothetical protein